jgi:hypothetical protein
LALPKKKSFVLLDSDDGLVVTIDDRPPTLREMDDVVKAIVVCGSNDATKRNNERKMDTLQDFIVCLID